MVGYTFFMTKFYCLLRQIVEKGLMIFVRADLLIVVQTSEYYISSIV